MNEIETKLRDSAAALAEAPPAGLDRQIVERAGGEKLVDVAYCSVDSPLGPLTVAGTRRGLVLVSYQEPDDELLQRLADDLSPRVLEAPAQLDEARRELDEYFEGEREEFELPLDWSLVRGFARRVLRATAGIRYGDVSTYTKVAGRAGNARASRAAGNALGSNPIPIVVPCHRVLRTGGAMGGYGGGVERKEFLLRLEGALPD
ncbi:MAG TPA: methylated-DNA--[protein]-cysteine S-methyltransferase [Thermoleophilaceae bacterium]|nr:methylated-DNA--[protein]-cysteine S-methyltransferase [Thermoleophilaceae bacterium]